MAVPIERELSALVAELGLDGLDRCTVSDQQGGAGVSQGVEPGGFESRVCENALPKAPREVPVAKRPTVRRGEHQCLVLCTDVVGEVLAQHGYKERWEHDVALLVRFGGSAVEDAIYISKRLIDSHVRPFEVDPVPLKVQSSSRAKASIVAAANRRA